MMSSAARLPRGNQDGYVLLLIMLVLVTGGVTFFSGAYTTIPGGPVDEFARQSLTLDNAASALKIYSMTDEDRPGSLPCPDFTGDGTTDINCLSTPDTVHVERLPWRTLDIGREAESLWYVMDSDFRDDPDAQPINAELDGSLTLQDAAGDDIAGFAALIVDPGDPLERQRNRGGENEDVTDYLDIEENIDGDNRFVDCSSHTSCNDRIIGISTNELFRLVQKRVLDAVKGPVENFIADTVSEQGYLPYAANLDSTECEPDLNRGKLPRSKGDCVSESFIDPDEFVTWLTANNWLDFVIYHVADSCTGSPCDSGDLVVDEKEDLAVVIGLAGAPIGDQDRKSDDPSIDDYLESGLKDGVYINQNKSNSNNDIYWGVSP